jgi:hypothetical protein
VIVGFTGTRNTPTQLQSRWLREYLTGVTELHHGACVGSDWLAHRHATGMLIDVVVHPGPAGKWRADECLEPKERTTVLPSKPYLDRNRDIVDACDWLLALPKELPGSEPMRGSGTWAAVRYARKKGKPIVICYPDGGVKYEGTQTGMVELGPQVAKRGAPPCA